MNLRHIRTTTCPHCAAVPKREEVSGQHTNGQFFETRTFTCGHAVEYVPNFQVERVSHECPKSAAVVSKHAKQRSLVEKLVDIAEKADVDDTFKKYLIADMRARVGIR